MKKVSGELIVNNETEPFIIPDKVGLWLNGEFQDYEGRSYRVLIMVE